MVSPFGASMLDMMTCSLGAVMLLMLMKQADGVIESIRLGRDQDFRGHVVETLHERRQTAANWADDALQEYRARGTGALFGIPPAEGSVVLAIDASTSMLAYGDTKAERATMAAESIMLTWSQVTHVAIVVFASDVDTALPWFELRSESDRRTIAESIESFARENRGASTDLLGALNRSMELLTQRPRGGTIVLLSDGEHAMVDSEGRPVELSAEAIVDRLSSRLAALDRRGQRVTLHAIGVFDYWPPGVAMTDDLALDILRDSVAAGYERGVDLESLQRASTLREAARYIPDSDALDLRNAATPDLAANLALGETLRRLTEQLGGRTIAYPIQPTSQ